MRSNLVAAAMLCLLADSEAMLDRLKANDTHQDLTIYMLKKTHIFTACLLLAVATGTTFAAWNPGAVAEYDKNAQIVLAAFKEKDPKVQKFIDAAAGYVVFPSVAKGGMGIGGARGKGVLYEGGVVTAVVTLTQLSIGFQLGGQAYSEFIFIEDAATLENFKHGNYELGAQVSAVAITAGASADASFEHGMAIFTQAKGGLMYEASVGGQKFSIELK
jgi:lipid-binding SYLF domain-containing protein